jgi:hypothetical protein
MAEYGSMFAVSGLAAILFFGGWNGPLPISDWLHLTPEHGPVFAYFGNFLGMLNFMFKCVAGVTFMMWARWTLPRLRIDQVMKVCLKYCVPIAAVMFLGAVGWTYKFPGTLGRPYAERVMDKGVPPAPAAADGSVADGRQGRAIASIDRTSSRSSSDGASGPATSILSAGSASMAMERK